eukprot:COSAG04_NODE_56_length_30604_cov_692.571119_21_plen_285_part_00
MCLRAAPVCQPASSDWWRPRHRHRPWPRGPGSGSGSGPARPRLRPRLRLRLRLMTARAPAPGSGPGSEPGSGPGSRREFERAGTYRSPAAAPCRGCNPRATSCRAGTWSCRGQARGWWGRASSAASSRPARGSRRVRAQSGRGSSGGSSGTSSGCCRGRGRSRAPPGGRQRGTGGGGAHDVHVAVARVPQPARHQRVRRLPEKSVVDAAGEVVPGGPAEGGPVAAEAVVEGAGGVGGGGERRRQQQRPHPAGRTPRRPSCSAMAGGRPRAGIVDRAIRSLSCVA